MRPRLILVLLAVVAIAACSPAPLEPAPLKCNRVPMAITATDTAWMTWSPVPGLPCT